MEENWSVILTNTHDADQQFDCLNSAYNRIYNAAYPTKRQSQRRQNERVNPKPWILPWLEEAIERKNQAYHDFVKEPDDRNQLKYDRL